MTSFGWLLQGFMEGWLTQRYTPLAKSLITPVLMYGSEIFNDCDSVNKRKLNVTYNSIARYIYGLRRYDNTSHYAKSINGQSIYWFFFIKFCKRINHCTFTIRYLSRSTRSCNLIPIRCNYLVSDRQFFIYSVRLWNSLPLSLRKISCTKLFRVGFMQHLENLWSWK